MLGLTGKQERLVELLQEQRALLLVLICALIVWAWIFSQAAVQFTTSTVWPRAVWNGFGSVDLFGYTINYSFEGWADHDYYYHSWADQFLSGIMPYTPEFDLLLRDDAYYSVDYFFPPLYLYICVLGKVLQPDIGIGIIITAFGFLTALPIYGIGKYLSGNKNVGAVAAATYLFNPIVLYHITFEWLNPAPFVFFSMLSFYLLMKNRRLSGTLAMVTSALFKQTAFFYALPLIAFILKRAPGTTSDEPTAEGVETDSPLSDSLDLRSFSFLALAAVGFAAVISLPYLLDPINYLRAIVARAGSTYLDDLTNPPPNNYPITLAVLFIIFGFPEWLSEAINLLTYYSIGLMIGIIPILAMMLIEVKDDNELTAYWRRILFLTLLLMLWIHIFSPRGIYKYYMVALVPFFSILSTSALCSKSTKNVNVSLPMILIPLLCSVLILVPPRTYYLFNLILIMLAYALHRYFSQTYNLAAQPLRNLGRRISSSLPLRSK
ncbi:MAG: hypothetical protein ACFFD6_04970 [Candidatus Thorarchaeota archaeon]